MKARRPVRNPLSECYPYNLTMQQDGGELLAVINPLVPRNIDESLRADACQELALGVCAGTITLDQLSGVVPDVIRSQRKFQPSRYRLSLDAMCVDEQPDRGLRI